jgi:hypothetical protein
VWLGSALQAKASKAKLERLRHAAARAWQATRRTEDMTLQGPPPLAAVASTIAGAKSSLARLIKKTTYVECGACVVPVKMCREF